MDTVLAWASKATPIFTGFGAWRVLFVVGGLVFFLVVETEKMIIRSSKLLRRTVTAAEAGA